MQAPEGEQVLTVLQAYREATGQQIGDGRRATPSPPPSSGAGRPRKPATMASVDLMERLAEAVSEDREDKKSPRRRGFQLVKAIVSKQKKRFTEDGFDLDLTYITPRVIAMGFPADGLEAMYRNSYRQVYDFFEKRYCGHYLIVNLCSERTYPAEAFNGRVRYCPFDDHHCCPMYQLHALVVELDAWLTDHPGNVVAIHCKAGKGRTGLVVSCLLLYRGYVTCADDALEAFAWFRTTDHMGVTIASQQRWVHYYAATLQTLSSPVAALPQPRVRRLRSVQLLADVFAKEHDVYFRISHAGGRCWRGEQCYHSLEAEHAPVLDERVLSWDALHVELVGDVLLTFKAKSFKSMVSTHLFRVWLHTDYMQSTMVFMADELDDVSKHADIDDRTRLLRLVCDE
eukprot:TRINITY_DN3142_c0_g4_i1.p1 TRINITY_DN3142_c0_g4~~TRINITY_DN3142_c0_g4_i1.p1  ORF type:complete len:399 (-),score=75.16 TRINITY_DN3142_c0_g4_i1:61-1257(-)